MQWYKGQHPPIVPQEIFDRCQQVRRVATGRRTPVRSVVTYPLSGLLYCGQCNAKMRAQKNPRGQRYYRRSGQIDWTNGCPQRMVSADGLETKLANFLTSMELPEKWEKDAVNAVGKLLGQERLQERIAEIKNIIERVDFRWDMGFTKQEQYIQKREELKAQLAELQSVPQDEPTEAHRMLKEFPELWANGNAEERQRLLSMILSLVWILDHHMCTLMLRRSYFTFVHEGIAKDPTQAIDPRELPPFVKKGNGHLRVLASDRWRERRASVVQRKSCS